MLAGVARTRCCEPLNLRKVSPVMRVLAYCLLIVGAAMVAAGCGGPDEPQTRLTAACERQLEEVAERAEEGDTPTAKSTQEHLDETTLIQCTGQRTRIVPADEATTEEGPAKDGETPPAEGGEQSPEAEEPEPVELDPAARELFASTCGGCHALSDADTNGAVGPNLDDTTLDAAAIAALIASGKGAMPPGLLQGGDADSVATYVAGAAAAE